MFSRISNLFKDGVNKIKLTHQRHHNEFDRMREEFHKNHFTYNYNFHSHFRRDHSRASTSSSSSSQSSYQHHHNFHNRSSNNQNSRGNSNCHNNNHNGNNNNNQYDSRYQHFYNHQNFYKRYYRHNPHNRRQQQQYQKQQNQEEYKHFKNGCNSRRYQMKMDSLFEKNSVYGVPLYCKLHGIIKHPIVSYYFLNSKLKYYNKQLLKKNTIYPDNDETSVKNTTTAKVNNTSYIGNGGGGGFNMSHSILSQNTSLKSIDASRYFGSSAPSFFVLSKVARIFVPIAMTGFRRYISKINIFHRVGLILVILGSATGTYLLVNQEQVPITGRSRIISYSKEEEHDLGEIGYQEMTKEYSSYFLPEDNAIQNKVRTIAKRIIDVTDRRDLNWECHVVNSETVNACVLPNGKIFVFSGLFDICESEDELASVLSHEVGHAVARHAAERLSLSKLGYMFLTLTRGLVGETITGNLTTLFSSSLLNLRYSRIQEIEADQIGLELMTKANYNPHAALSIQKKLQKYALNSEKDVEGVHDPTKTIQSQSMAIDFLSTHPSPEERVTKIEKWLIDNAHKLKNQPINSSPNTSTTVTSPTTTPLKKVSSVSISDFNKKSINNNK